MKSFINILYAEKLIPILVIALILVACSPGQRTAKIKRTDQHPSVSELYNHFEGGFLFTDVRTGLEILWQASFKNGKAYKENLAFFVDDGLLILPNVANSRFTARLSALPITVFDNKLFVKFQSSNLRVLAIIHTHPEVCSLREPAPRRDFQYAYLGIHNYVMGHRDLFDAYKDAKGYETFVRLGARDVYHKIPLLNPEKEAHLTYNESPNPQLNYE